MDAWYLGYCLSSPTSARPGRVLPLTRLRQSELGRFVSDDTNDFEGFGPSGKVFWPQYPPSPQDLTKCVVRFRYEETAEYGGDSPTRDWLKIAKSTGGDWECKRIGHRIVRLGVDADWRQEPPWVRGLAEGEQIFVLDDSEDVLVGLWRVSEELIGEPGRRRLTPEKVYSYPLDKLEQDSLYSADLPSEGSDSTLYLLLSRPVESIGELVDVSSTRQLAKWLVDQINRQSPALIARLEKVSPGWRARIREDIAKSPESEQRLMRRRWDRLDAILQGMVLDDEQISRLLQHPEFLKRFDEGVASRIREAVNRRTLEVEAAAANRTSEFRAQLEAELAKLKTRRMTLESEVTRLEACRDAQVEQERRLRQMTEHLVESRNRLILDAAALQPLFGIQDDEHSGSNGQVVCFQPTVLVNDASASTTEGSPVATPLEFVDSRLWPALHSWLPGTPRGMAIVLHAAISGCKATLVPNPAWVKAYLEALGGSAKLTIVTVEPTWLGFEDLWNGGLGDSWQRALHSANTIELVLVRDLNRSLPQCYARPLLDLLAGFADALPSPGRGGWPQKLRLLACPVPSSEGLPLARDVVRHFAAIQKEPAACADDGPSEMKAAHLAADTWLGWSTKLAVSIPRNEWPKDFGPLVRAVVSDVNALVSVLNGLGLRERDAVEHAIDIRINDAIGYADFLDMAPRRTP
jgi:hypothetical protein